MTSKGKGNRRLTDWSVTASDPAGATASAELGSGYHVRRRAPSASEYRLRWADQELEVPNGAEFSIGRAPECLLRLGGTLVSRHHARLRRDPEGLVIEDLSSLNGVLVNQRRISGAVLLQHGDVIAIGEEHLEVLDMVRVRLTAHLSTVTPPPVAVADGDTDQAGRVSAVPALGELGEDERELLEQIVLGYADREIALSLNLSVGAIERLRAQLSKRIQCHTRGELVTYAICSGLMRGR
jgi:DNA-binding CsgD family transcriptional regulator